MAPLTRQELYQFHKTDREVFSYLVINLGHDLARSLLVTSLWFWLEHIGYPSVISRLVRILNNIVLINAITNEAVSCLCCLEHQNFPIPSGGGLPFTSNLMQREISLQLFVAKRFTAVAGIKNALNNICARIFTDILYLVSGIISPRTTSTTWPNYTPPLIIPGFPHALFGTFIAPPINHEEMMDLSDPRVWTKGPFDDVSDDDKTMFLTFSRGFHVTEDEVRDHFTSTYGDCIKVLNMGSGDTINQVLYATLVLKSVETVDQILNGGNIAKFRVNGKHIWARKYESRD